MRSRAPGSTVIGPRNTASLSSTRASAGMVSAPSISMRSGAGSNGSPSAARISAGPKLCVCSGSAIRPSGLAPGQRHPLQAGLEEPGRRADMDRDAPGMRPDGTEGRGPADPACGRSCRHRRPESTALRSSSAVSRRRSPVPPPARPRRGAGSTSRYSGLAPSSSRIARLHRRRSGVPRGAAGGPSGSPSPAGRCRGGERRQAEARRDQHPPPPLDDDRLGAAHDVGDAVDAKQRALALVPADRVAQLVVPALRVGREQLGADQLGEIGQEPGLDAPAVVGLLGEGVGIGLLDRAADEIEHVPEAVQIGFEVAELAGLGGDPDSGTPRGAGGRAAARPTS